MARPEGMAERITRNIRDQIHAGALRHGQALPSTRQLAADWEVSVKTINAALAPLVAEGLVVSRDRAGRTVNAPNQEPTRMPRPPEPQVVLIGGYAGSGKTELGRMLVRATGWAILDKDTTTRPVVEAALEMLGQPPNDREGTTYLTGIRPAEYEALMSTMSENVECGASTVVTAPFLQEMTNRSWLDRVNAQCEALSAKLTVVWVSCDADSMRSYLKHRGAARDTWKLSNWDEYLSSINLEFRPDFEHFLIDNSRDGAPLNDQAKELIEHIYKAAE
jgi:predicted kinase